MSWRTGLRDYQQTGAEWLVDLPGDGTRARFLCDGLGTGKCRTALGAMQLREEQGLIDNPCHLVFTTAISAHDWKREANIYRPSMPVHILGTEPTYKRKLETDAEFDLRKHGQWRDMLRGKLGPALVVGDYASATRVDEFISSEDILLDSTTADEVHVNLKRDSTKRGGLLRTLIARSRQTTMLSATPVHNRPHDLYNILDLCKKSQFKSFWKFAEKYFLVGVSEGGFGRTIGELLNKEALDRDIRPWIWGRAATEVMGELPPRQRVLKKVTAPDVLRISPAKIHLLKSGDEQALRECVKFKMQAAVDLTVDVDKPVVLYTYRREDASKLAAMLKKAKVTCTLATGDVNAAKRAKLIDEWKAGATTALVCTMDAVRESATLTRADVMIFVDLTWLSGTILQCEGRIDPARQPEGERRPVTYYFIVVDNGPDELVAEALVTKIEQASGIGVKNIEADKLGDFLKPLDKRLEEVNISPEEMLRAITERVDSYCSRLAELEL